MRGLLRALIVVAVLLAVAILALNGRALPRGPLLRRTPQIEAALGRPVTFGAVRLWLLPWPEVEVQDLRIGGAPLPAPLDPSLGRLPLLRITSLRAILSFKDIFASLGKRIALSRLSAVGVELNVIRLPDGRFSVDDVIERLRAAMPLPPPPEVQRWLRRVSVARVSVRGRVALHDLDAPAGRTRSVVLEDIELGVAPLAVERPLEVTLRAAVAATAPNVHLSATLAPLRADLGAPAPADLLRRAALRIERLEAGPLLEWLSPILPWVAPERGLVDLDLRMERPGGARIRLDGTVGLRHLTLRRADVLAPAGRGAPTDVALRAAVDADWEGGAVRVERAELRVNDMLVRADADLRDLWTAPRVEVLSLSSQGLLLERLLAIAPPSVLPPWLVLRGPLRLYGSLAGPPDRARVELGADFTDAEIAGLVIDKPAGLDGAAELRCTVGGGRVEIERLGVVLGSISMWARGTVRSPRDIDLRIDSGALSLSPVVERSPAALRRLRRTDTLTGRASISGHLRRKQDVLDASAQIELFRARLGLRAVRLRGSGRAAATLRHTPETDALRVDADLGDVGLWVRGALNKSAGDPLRLRLAASRAGGRYAVERVELSGPGVSLQAEGAAEPSRRRAVLDARLGVDLLRLATVVPALGRAALPAARVRGAFHLEGDPGRPEALRLRARELVVQAAGGQVRGTVDLDGLAPPSRVDFDLQGGGLDLARLAEQLTPARPTHVSLGPLLPTLRALAIDGQLRLSDVAVRGVAMRDLALDVHMADGRVTLPSARAAAFGGSLSLGGSGVDLSAGPPSLILRGRADGIDLQQLLAAVAPKAVGKAAGRVSAVVQASSRADSGAELLARLRGSAGVTLSDGEVRDVTIRAKITNGEIKGLVGPDGLLQMHRDRIGLRAMTARFVLRDGVLHIQDAVRLANEEMVMELRGQIGLDGKLALRAALELLPAAFANATGGKLRTAAAVPVQMRISGDAKLPLIDLQRLDETVSVLSGGLLGAARAPELYAPQPVPGQPGRDAAAGAPPLSLLRPPRPRYMFNLRLGPSLGLLDLPRQAILAAEGGVALTPDRHGYLVFGLQLQLAGGIVGLVLPVGFQYDFRLPIRHLYLSPRLSLGYAALLDPAALSPTPEHLGVAMAELGLTYSPIRRFNFGLMPAGVSVFFDGTHARVAYRMLALGGVNF